MASMFNIPIYSAKYTPAMNNYIHHVCDQRFNAEYLLPHYQNIQSGTLAIHEELPYKKLEYLIDILTVHINLGEHINSRADYDKYKRNSNSINMIIDELGPLLYDINHLNAITAISLLSELPPLPKFENLYKVSFSIKPTSEIKRRRRVERQRQSMASQREQYLSSKSKKGGRKSRNRRFTKKRRN